MADKHTSNGLSVAKVESILDKIRNLPPVDKSKQQLSKQEAIRMMAADIAKLQKKGYSLQLIADTLRAEGLEIATPTLKNYLQRARPSRRGATKAAQEQNATDESAGGQG